MMEERQMIGVHISDINVTLIIISLASQPSQGTKVVELELQEVEG